ncbi:helix-turn-helix transcriptional regulator [Aliidongia dinghuensis]|uniref:helix-turn-helix transcriptional regulator n=1 Tax=Aliidongia dinghuensis TaxID=1867774 RepID=UPI001E655CE0|nr:AraC family transcriptional regulator [Aliidongia dinghuensis]
MAGLLVYAGGMTTTARLLASGDGWSVRDLMCTAGPATRPFEERHGAMCIAAVLRGSFQYRAAPGAALLAPGALLLGNADTCFECGHAHGVGDHCVSFHFDPAYFERILAAVPGARRLDFTRPSLPPAPALIPLLAVVEAAVAEPTDIDAPLLEELGLRLAGAVAAMTAGRKPSREPSRRDERRIGAALRRLEQAEETIPLAELARDAAMSPFHFLRTFRRVAGVTPYQFVLGERMRRAAVCLSRTDEPVSAIAYDAGFGDLSTFNRRFRRVMGASPTAYRRGGSP